MTTDRITEEADYPALFQQYILRSVTLVYTMLKDEGAHFSDEARDRALHLLNFALTQENAWSAIRDLLLLLAPKMEQAGHRDDWLPYLERGVTGSRQQHDSWAEAELSLAIGELLRLRSRFALARQWLDVSIAMFDALGENRGQARALNELAFVAWQQHRYDEAETLAQTALTLLDKGDPEQATCFSRLGLVASDRQQWEAAEHYHCEALQIRQVQGDQRKIAWSQHNLGYALRGQGKYAEAIDYFEQAIVILDNIQDTANCANVQVNLGIAYSLNGQSTKALTMYALAEHTFGKLYDIHNLAKVFTNIGLEYLGLHDWMQAESAFITSSNLFRELGDIGWSLNALDGLGNAYLGQGQYTKASVTFESVLAELQQIADTPMYDYLAKILPNHLAEARQKERNSQNEAYYGK
ncbi:MAG: tetratricopeptide repeat protein [Caldilinea sp. CFX5]|nr:tetratricopeptide repeat protein [Caldilinea sp. CFX5]